MPTYTLRHLPEGLIPRATAKAREAGTVLDDTVLVKFLEMYAAHGSIQSSGGHARALSMTAEQRSASAKHAVQAREARKTA